MEIADTRPNRGQTDAEILTALGLDPADHRIDRTDIFALMVIATDENQPGVEGITGRAMLVLDHGRKSWVLGCSRCYGRIDRADGGMCDECRCFIHEAGN